MLKKALVTLFICTIQFCKGDVSPYQIDALLTRAEAFILNNELDSAKVALQEIPIQSQNIEYNLVYNIIHSKDIKEKDILELLSILQEKGDFDAKTADEYLTNQFKPPHKNMSRAYVDLKVFHVMFLLDNDLSEKASNEFSRLNKVVNQMNKTTPDYNYAQFKLNIYHSTIALIKQDLESGKKIYQENLILIDELKKDTLLWIEANFKFLPFLKIQRQIDEFIEMTESTLELDRLIHNKSPYKTDLMFSLVDAYSYKATFRDDYTMVYRIPELLDELYSSHSFYTHIQSHYYYMEYLGFLDLDSKEAIQIFEKFKVKDIVELNAFILDKTRPAMSDLEFINVLMTNSISLEHHKLYREALKLKNEAVKLFRYTYSKNLAEAISKHDIAVLEEEVKHEVEILTLEKRNSVLLSILCLLLVIIALLAIRAQRAKNKRLHKRHEEKALLLKEIHHRIKNNFQLATGLLNIQFRGLANPEIDRIIQQWDLRVKSMIAVHQGLYQNDESRLGLKTYILALLEHSEVIYNGIELQFNVEVHEKLTLDIDTAMKVGLILNELINNSFKHGVNKDQLKLNITCVKDGLNYRLLFSDSGEYKQDYITQSTNDTFGIKLIKSLAKELKGDIIFTTTEEKLNINFTFKDKHQ